MRTIREGKLLIEEFILRYWSDWMDIITKVGKFKVRCVCRSSILKINPYTYEDVLEDYKIQNSMTNFLHPGGNDAGQEIEEILIRFKYIIFRNILINLYSNLNWFPI